MLSLQEQEAQGEQIRQIMCLGSNLFISSTRFQHEHNKIDRIVTEVGLTV